MSRDGRQDDCAIVISDDSAPSSHPRSTSPEGLETEGAYAGRFTNMAIYLLIRE
jgi:hypothetical protein